MDELEEEHKTITRTTTTSDDGALKRRRRRILLSSPAVVEHGIEQTDNDLVNQAPQETEREVSPDIVQPRILKRCSFWKVPGVNPSDRAKRGRK
jgi:hypothetical protein